MVKVKLKDGSDQELIQLMVNNDLLHPLYVSYDEGYLDHVSEEDWNRIKEILTEAGASLT